MNIAEERIQLNERKGCRVQITHLSKLTAAIYGVSCMKQKLAVHHFNLGSHQLYKVGRVFSTLQKRKTRTRKVRCLASDRAGRSCL